jgi:hypothetical protein
MTPIMKLRIAFVVLMSLPLPALAALMAWDLAPTYPAKVLDVTAIAGTYFLAGGLAWWGLRRFRTRPGAVPAANEKVARAAGKRLLRVIKMAGLVTLLDLYFTIKFVVPDPHPSVAHIAAAGAFFVLPLALIAVAVRRYKAERLAQQA